MNSFLDRSSLDMIAQPLRSTSSPPLLYISTHWISIILDIIQLHLVDHYGFRSRGKRACIQSQQDKNIHEPHNSCSDNISQNKRAYLPIVRICGQDNANYIYLINPLPDLIHLIQRRAKKLSSKPARLAQPPGYGLALYAPIGIKLQFY